MTLEIVTQVMHSWNEFTSYRINHTQQVQQQKHDGTALQHNVHPIQVEQTITDDLQYNDITKQTRNDGNNYI